MSDPRGDARVRWSTVEEHLEEAEFTLGCFEASLSAADVTLEELAAGMERRFLANVRGLVLGGEPVVERLLAPALAEKDVTAARATAVIVTLLRGGRAELATRALWHPSARVRQAALRGCALAAGASLDSWLAQRLAMREASADRVPLLELAAERGLVVPSALESLEREPRHISAALRTLYGADPRPLESQVIALLGHPDPLVRDAALVASLHHGSPHGWALCQELAFDPREPHPLAMVLVAGLGEPGLHKRLAQQVDSAPHRPGALRALGYSGNAGMIPLLVFHAHSADERTAKLAGEAIATIAGVDVNALVPPKQPAPAVSNAGSLPPPEEDEEARRSLPPLEEDDLDVDLVPPQEDALPTLDGAAVSTWWMSARTRFDVGRRYLGGAVATRGAFAQALAELPMRRRYLLSVLLSIRTGGAARVSTRAFSATQRAQIASVAKRPEEAWSRVFSAF